MRLARFLVLMFFVLIVLNTSRDLLEIYTGIVLKDVFASGLLPIAILFLVPGALLYESKLGRRNPLSNAPAYRFCLVLFAGWTIGLFLQGVLQGYRIQNIIIDLWIFTAIWMFTLIGRHDQVWEDLYKPLALLLVGCYILVYVGLGHMPRNLNLRMFVQGIEYRSSVATIGYDANELLNLWPLFFLLGYFRKRWDAWKLLGFAFFIGYVLFMIYFQKRAPFARAVVYGVVLYLLTPLVRRKAFSSVQTIALTGVFLLGGAMVLLSETFSESMLLLGERYTEPDTSRFDEAMMLLEDFDTLEYLIGRGLGGYYIVHGWSHLSVLDVAPVDDQGRWGRLALHVGALYPFIKGGLLYCAVYYSFLPLLLSRAFDRRWLAHPCNSTAFTFALVYFLFELTEGAPHAGNPFDGVLVGLAYGRTGTPRTPMTGQAAGGDVQRAGGGDGQSGRKSGP
jgi:hypothetical protein